jgi:hypothetical protein
VGLERGPLSLVSTTEELLEGKSTGSGKEIRDYGRRDPSRWPRGTLCLQKLAPTSPTSGGRSVSIVRSRSQATEFVLFVFTILVTNIIISKKYPHWCKVIKSRVHNFIYMHISWYQCILNFQSSYILYFLISLNFPMISLSFSSFYAFTSWSLYNSYKNVTTKQTNPRYKWHSKKQ